MKTRVCFYWKSTIHSFLDKAFIEQLFDQFIDHALSTISEAKNTKRKKLLPEDIEFAEQKADKLWLFGWACAARLGWDLNALLKWFAFLVCIYL
jgi:hypothetical protein